MQEIELIQKEKVVAAVEFQKLEVGEFFFWPDTRALAKKVSCNGVDGYVYIIDPDDVDSHSIEDFLTKEVIPVNITRIEYEII